MTDRTQPDAGSTHIIRYALELGLLWIDGDGRNKVREALAALDALEAKLESIGAGEAQALSAAPAGPWSLGEMTGNWRDIDLPDHGAVMRIVWKMEDDEGRNEKLEAQAHAVVAALNAALSTPPAEQQAITPETGNSVSAQGAAITSESSAVYAELPDFDSSEEPIWEAVFKWRAANPGPDAGKKAMAVESAIIKSLRDFADRTHALRMQVAPKSAQTWPSEALVWEALQAYLKHDTNMEGMRAALIVGAAPQQAAPKAAQYEMDKEASNVRLDIDSNSTKPEQQRDVACSLEVGQHVGNGEHQGASCRGSEDSELLKIAARNLKYFIEHAQFSSFADKRAALNCLDALVAPPAEQAAPKAAPGEPGWWRKRADEIEGQVALTGSPEAMRCYTDMRTLLQAAAGAAPQQEAQEPVALLVRKNSWRAGQWEAAPPDSPSYGLTWANQRKYVYEAPQPAPAELERLRERISKMGLDVDRAMRGHINEQSPLGTTRLAAIAALAKPAPAPLSDDAKDAARWRWLSEHIGVAWNEGKFTSLVRIVSDKNRAALNASIDRMMTGDWSDAALAAQKGTP